MITQSILILFFLTFTTAYRPGDETCIITPTNPCTVDTLIPSQTDASTLIYPGGKTRCAFDDYTSALFQTNSSYFFQVFPKRNSKKLLIFFKQGGACISDMTCNFATQCSILKRTFQYNAIAMSTGVLDAFDPDNIFYDWNVIQVPYCTGDIFIGNRVNPPKDIPFPFFRNSCAHKNMSTYLNGYENTMSALQWGIQNYPNPERIVLAGSSAGALGVQLLANKVADLWQIEQKNITFGVVADAYVGVVPRIMTTGSLIKYYNGCHVLPNSVINKCLDGSATTLDMMQEILTSLWYSDWLHVTSLNDWVQRFYLNALLFKLNDFFKTWFTQNKFFEAMDHIIKGEQQVSESVKVFYIEGFHHMYLIENGWYNTKHADSEETLGSYIKAWLENGTRASHSPIQKPL